MTGNSRWRFSAAIKARVAIEALREQKAAAQIPTDFECHPSKWPDGRGRPWMGLQRSSQCAGTERPEDRMIASPYEQIGRLRMELEWFEKRVGASA